MKNYLTLAILAVAMFCMTGCPLTDWAIDTRSMTITDAYNNVIQFNQQEVNYVKTLPDPEKYAYIAQRFRNQFPEDYATHNAVATQTTSEEVEVSETANALVGLISTIPGGQPIGIGLGAVLTALATWRSRSKDRRVMESMGVIIDGVRDVGDALPPEQGAKIEDFFNESKKTVGQAKGVLTQLEKVLASTETPTKPRA